MKTANLTTILGVSCALAFTALLAPTSRADVWTVNPDGGVTRTETTSSSTTANTNNTVAGGAQSNATQNVAGDMRTTRTQSRGVTPVRTTGGRDDRATSRYSTQGVKQGTNSAARYHYGTPGYGVPGYGTPGYGYYPPYPVPVYEPPISMPLAPQPIGYPAWITSFPVGGFNPYPYPYPYAYPYLPYPTYYYQYPGFVYYSYPGYAGGFSSKSSYGNVSIGSGNFRVSIGGSNQTTTSTTTTSTYPYP